MATKDEYVQPVLSTEQVLNELQDCSPLQVSKQLINMELHDQRKSLEVMAKIYDEFDTNTNLVDELVEPISLNVLDAFILHPKLKNLKFKAMGISSSRIWNESKQFSYEDANSSDADPLDQYMIARERAGELNQAVNSKLAGKYARSQNDARKQGYGANTNRYMDDDSKKVYSEKHFQGRRRADSELEVNHDGSVKRIWNEKKHAPKGGANHNNKNTDHTVSLKEIFDDYGSNIALSSDDLQAIGNIDDNFKNITAELNNLKRESSWTEVKTLHDTAKRKQAAGQSLSNKEARSLTISDGTIENALEAESLTNKAIQTEAEKRQLENIWGNKKGIRTKVAKKIGTQGVEKAANQSRDEALGHALVLFIKPLLFEMTDIVKHGFTYNTGETCVGAAIAARFKRLSNYMVTNVLPTLKQSFTGFISNFFQNLIAGLGELFKGLLGSILKVVSEGFNAIIQAFKILTEPESSRSKAEKADAFLKLIATTTVTFVVFYFEKTILQALEGSFLKDIILALLTGVASTLVVWALDKMDLFSVKDEKRAARVKEIFDMRIRQIKQNTDAFETAALQTLANNKLQFRQISESMSKAIDDDENVNSSIYSMADFMKIELEIKTTDDFMALLGSQDRLVVS